jgi:HSP20 family protein
VIHAKSDVRDGTIGFRCLPASQHFRFLESALIVAEAPVLDAAKLNVSGTGHTLTLSGERVFEPDGDGRGYYRRELNEGKFSRSIQLSEDYEPANTEARSDARLLIIRVPRGEHAKPRQITMQTA